MSKTPRSKHVACCCDGAYLPHLATMLTTLADHNNPREIIIHFLNNVDDLSELEKFCSYVTKVGFSLNVINVDPTLFENYPQHGHVTQASYYRLALPDVLPEEIDRVVFLDCDMCVSDDLSPLWELGLDDHMLAAVESPDDPKGDRQRLGLAREDLYFNAGMMVLNLERLRRYQLLSKSQVYLQKNRERIRWWDQDILNALLSGHAMELGCEWNYLPMHGNNANLPRIKIVHFSGGGSRKPWNYNCKSRYRALYVKARARTPWHRYRLDGSPSIWSHAKSVCRRTLSKLRIRLDKH